MAAWLHRFKPDRVLDLRGGGKHGIPSLTRKLSAADKLPQRKKWLPPGESPWVDQPRSSTGPVPNSRWSPQTKSWYFCRFVLSLTVLYGHFFCPTALLLVY